MNTFILLILLWIALSIPVALLAGRFFAWAQQKRANRPLEQVDQASSDSKSTMPTMFGRAQISGKR